MITLSIILHRRAGSLSGLKTAILNLLRAMYVSMGSLIVTGFNGGFVQAIAGILDGTNELFPALQYPSR